MVKIIKAQLYAEGKDEPVGTLNFEDEDILIEKSQLRSFSEKIAKENNCSMVYLAYKEANQ